MNSDEQVVFRDYPVWLWLAGVMTIVAGVAANDTVWEQLLFALAGVAIVGFSPVLTVAIDPRRETLSLRYRSLFRVSTKIYRRSEILRINVTEDTEGERLYRLELTLRSGEVVPLRSSSTIGKRRKRRRAQRLMDALRIRS
jgi:hypothetical protein